MKTCFHSHFMQIFMSFYEGKLKQQIMLQFFTANFSHMLFNPFPNFDEPNVFFPKFNRPLTPGFREKGKYPSNLETDY